MSAILEYKLKADRVEEVFMNCLFMEDESTDNYVVVEGITINVGFNPKRLEGHKVEIFKMLMELPTEFRRSSVTGGGGWSFLNACNDRHGNQWTGFHRTMEQLFCLGIASGTVRSLMPRDMWKVLPGGMPYYEILDNGEEN